MEKNIEARILKLINALSDIPEETKSFLIEFATHSECGIAFEDLCFHIDDIEIRITKDQYKEIVSLGAAMNYNETTWIELKKLIKA